MAKTTQVRGNKREDKLGDSSVEVVGLNNKGRPSLQGD
jgi:hypothetical protein